MTLAERLKEQNALRVWLDCEDRTPPVRHRLRPLMREGAQVYDYVQCRRCHIIFHKGRWNK